jgi:hypothetical protein
MRQRHVSGPGFLPPDPPSAAGNGPGEIVWPFGQHKNKRLCEIPSTYLQFIIDENDGRHHGLVLDCQDELARRAARRERQTGTGTGKRLFAIVSDWRRTMATKHPAARAVIDEGAELLQELLLDQTC